MQEIQHILRILPIHIINTNINWEESLHIGDEFESLIKTFGGKIVDLIIQKMNRPDMRTFIGSGKVLEVEKKVSEDNIDVVILNAMAKPRQVDALKRILEKINPAIEVWDRVDLILHIFEKHARTSEAKLQIELARMKYMGPRIYGMGFVLSQQGGGIGTRGIGETNTELMKRHWRREIKKVSDQLDKITRNREQQLRERKLAGYKTISLVGYTNAGKSSLFNLLTGKQNLVENALFATLDSTVGKIYIPQLQGEVLITDTIGFIRDLPPRLISAFKSTLMESVQADILLHIIDASDPEIDIKIKVVSDILKELGCNVDRVLYVFNKSDKLSIEQQHKLIDRFKPYSPILVSSITHEGVVMLLRNIGEKVDGFID